MSFIAPSKVFQHLDRLAAWRDGAKPAPVTVEWDLSNRCYLGCQSCHFAHTHSRGPWVVKERRLPMAWEGTGDLASTPMVCRALGEMADAGVQGVIWSGGGEPTMHPDWQDIVRVTHGLNVEQGMYTAGGLLDEYGAEVLATYLEWVVVSLDTLDARNYAIEKGVPEALFGRACEGVRQLSSHKRATIGVSFLLHQQNWSQAGDMVALGRSLGANYVTFRPTIDTAPDDPATITADRRWVGDALPLLEILSRERDVEVTPARFAEYRDWTGRSYATCHGIKLNATVTPDGRVWLCPQHRGKAGSCVGDLRTQSFAELWKSHPGSWSAFEGCRAMCRLHLVNEVLEPVFESYQHPAFV